MHVYTSSVSGDVRAYLGGAHKNLERVYSSSSLGTIQDLRIDFFSFLGLPTSLIYSV